MKRGAPLVRRTPLQAKAPIKRGSTSGRRRKKAASAAEKAYMGRVAAVGCLVCSSCFQRYGVAAEVHHLKAGGGSKRASHWDTMPLCPEHHRGNTGIHMLGQEGFHAMYGVYELELLHWFQRLMRTDEARRLATEDDDGR
jgi:hypothetical protein